MTLHQRYSAEVQGWLIVENQRYPLSQVGPAGCVLKTAANFPPTTADVLIEVDGAKRRVKVQLTSNGKPSRNVAFEQLS